MKRLSPWLGCMLWSCLTLVMLAVPVVNAAEGQTDAQKLEVLKSEVLKIEVQATIDEFKRRDPTLEKFFNDAKGYVVFPSIVKGGFIIGGAHGKGLLFKESGYAGVASVTQATVGLQVGGATYREIIFFQEPWRLQQFMTGNFAFSASASAVAVKAGAAKNVRYNRGVAVFTLAKGGLMLEASVGGQKFGFKPLPAPPAAAAPEATVSTKPVSEPAAEPPVVAPEPAPTVTIQTEESAEKAEAAVKPENKAPDAAASGGKSAETTTPDA